MKREGGEMEGTPNSKQIKEKSKCKLLHPLLFSKTTLEAE